MRCAGLVLAMILLTGVAYGQIGIGGVIIPTQSIPANLPPLVFPSNSVMDHDGNLLIFETSVGSTILATLQGSVKTHIAVVSSDGKTKNGYDYNGSFQVVGVGQNAVYAIVTSINTATFAFIRNLVALRVVAGTLPGTLPSVAAGSDVKLLPGTTLGEADRIAMIDSVFLPVLSTGTPAIVSPSLTHTVRLFTSDGTSFVTNPNNPISTQ